MTSDRRRREPANDGDTTRGAASEPSRPLSDEAVSTPLAEGLIHSLGRIEPDPAVEHAESARPHTDRIFIRGMRLAMFLGVTDEERDRPQMVELGLEIEFPLERAAASDDVHHTIDYGAVVERIRDVVAPRRFRLVEMAARTICDLVITEFGASRCVVDLAKIDRLPGVDRLGVRIARSRKDFPGPVARGPVN